MPAKVYASSKSGKALQKGRTKNSLNVRMREPIAKITTTAKMSGSANLGAPIRAAGGTIKKEMTLSNVVNVEFPDAADDRHMAAVIDFLRSDGRVDVVEPDYVVKAIAMPNDPRFSELWGLSNSATSVDVGAVPAWDQTTGSPAVVVGIIDTGIDCDHEDLRINCWTNPGESGLDAQGRDRRTNAIDDDNNGYIDDWRGWNFVANNNNATDDNKHGTHVAGTIGAAGNNNSGVTGVNWRVSVVPLKFLAADGTGTVSDAILALEYATRMGMFATNNSWGGGGYSLLMESALKQASDAGSLFVAAAGNDSNDNDANPSYPANYAVPNVISVAAVDINGNIAWFSNTGARTVHVAAPGVDILSTLPGNNYGRLSGTSMATPHVTGILALMKARFPGASGLSLKSRLLDGVNARQTIAGRVSTGGIVSAPGGLNAPADTTPPSVPRDVQVSQRGVTSAMLSWQLSGDDGERGSASGYRVRISPGRIVTQSDWDSATEITVTVRTENSRAFTDMTSLPAGYSGWIALRAFDDAGNQSWHSDPVELKLIPLRQIRLLDGTSMNGTAGNTPWTIENDPVRGPVFSDGPGPYPSDARRRMTLREIPLKGAQNIALSYWSRASLEESWDYGNVLVSYPGQPEAEWRKVDSVTGQHDWELRSVDLTYFISQALTHGADSIQLHFEMTSDASIEYQGWLVDDIALLMNDSLVTLTGLPMQESDRSDVVAGISAPPGTTYTSAFLQSADPLNVDCWNDANYATPAPSIPSTTELRLTQDALGYKWLCVRTNVPGYKGYITAWAGWRLKGPDIRVVASGQPTGESNVRSFNLTVSPGDAGNPVSFSTALTRPQTASDACKASDLQWSAWIPIGQAANVDVFSFLQGSDSDIVLCVRGRDAAGNIQASPLGLPWRADFHAPEVAIDSTIAPVNNLTRFAVQISVRTSGTPGSGGTNEWNICGFTVVRDTTTCPRDWQAYGSCAFAPASADIFANRDARWTVCAAAIDRAGNMSTSPASATWIRDTVPPVPELSGNPLITSKSPTGTVAVRGADLVTYRYATGRTAADCKSWSNDIAASTPVTLSVIPGGEGQNTLCVSGRDAAGNESTSPATLTWTQDTEAAALTFAGLPAANSSATSLRVSVNAAEPGTYRYIVAAGTTCNVTNLMRATRRQMNEPVSASLPLADGNYTLCALFTDTAGNDQVAPTTFTWVKDTVAPVASFTRNPPARTLNPVIEFAIGGNGVTAYQWALLDGVTACGTPVWSAFIPATDPVSLNAGQPGSKLICVRGRDAAGNVQGTPTSYRWTLVPPAPPEIQVVSGAPFSPTGKNSWSIVTGGDRVTSWQYAFINSQTSDCGSVMWSAWNPARTASGPNPIRLSDSSPDGYRTLCIRGKDAFDLVQTTPAIVRWLKVSGAPQVEPVTTWGTITRPAATGTTENLVLTRASSTNVAESISLRMCPVAETTGRLGSCKTANVSFAAGATTRTTSITNVGSGAWVVIALPPQGRGRVEPLLVRK